MPMTEEQKEIARLYRQQQYRAQKEILDQQKRDKKKALRAEKEKSLWSFFKKASDLEGAARESADDLR